MKVGAWLSRKIAERALRDPGFRFLFDEEPPDEAVSLDCETTGFDTKLDDVISVAAIPIRGNRILTHEAFRAVIRPEAAMRVESMKVHRLLKADVKGGQDMAEVFPDLLRFIGARPVVGYWIDFDMKMLNKYAQRMLGLKLPNRRIEVSSLYYERKYSGVLHGGEIDLRLDSIRTDLGLPPINQHDAFEDALLAAEMYVVLRSLKARGQRIPRRPV